MAKKKPKTSKKQVKESTADNSINKDVLAAAYGAVSQSVIPVLQKVCRLCASKDGPFLNIFEADKLTAKRIDELMPFRVLENDHLPHKICFRCSAKLEELYEFVQKCIKTQENLNEAVGVKNGLVIKKNKTAKNIWEDKLNKIQMSNEDICDALIKKAMEGIQSIVTNNPSSTEESVGTNSTTAVKTENSETISPAKSYSKSLTTEFSPLENKRVTRSRESQAINEEKSIQQIDGTGEPNLWQVKMSSDQDDVKPLFNKQTATIASSPNELVDMIHSNNNKLKQKKSVERKTNNSMSSLSFDYKVPEDVPAKENVKKKQMKEQVPKPFDIMEHISMIKVNGVGTLFQCQLCNRNFLKKEVVESHHCAKTGVPPRIGIPNIIPPAEPPKAINTVKYITIDEDTKKSLTERLKGTDKSENKKLSNLETIAIDEDSEEPPKVKTKPKVGPASKTRRGENNSIPSSENQTAPLLCTNIYVPSTSTVSSVQVPATPNLNSRFKLFPGPNNIYTLVEDSNNTDPPITNDSNQAIPTPVEEDKKSNRKRKSNNITVINTEISQEIIGPDKEGSSEVINLEDAQPYPVGLFQTVANSVTMFEPTVLKPPPGFTTPAMKKQSYTIVQTDNPSKLLISAKPVEQDVSRKRQRKSKHEVKDDSTLKAPYKVTLEDVAPTKEPSGFFTFINVDPLLQPSYVLPTVNIIQESQISTSSAVSNQNTQKKVSKEEDKYTCNMCGENFSREKKLLGHIKSHYTKMDEEDQMRADNKTTTTKKKGKK